MALPDVPGILLPWLEWSSCLGVGSNEGKSTACTVLSSIYRPCSLRNTCTFKIFDISPFLHLTEIVNSIGVLIHQRKRTHMSSSRSGYHFWPSGNSGKRKSVSGAQRQSAPVYLTRVFYASKCAFCSQMGGQEWVYKMHKHRLQ